MTYEEKTIAVCNNKTGIVRKIDRLGRLVLSKDFRDRFGWEISDDVEQIFLTDGTILLRKIKEDT